MHPTLLYKLHIKRHRKVRINCYPYSPRFTRQCQIDDQRRGAVTLPSVRRMNLELDREWSKTLPAGSMVRLRARLWLQRTIHRPYVNRRHWRVE